MPRRSTLDVAIIGSFLCFINSTPKSTRFSESHEQTWAWKSALRHAWLIVHSRQLHRSLVNRLHPSLSPLRSASNTSSRTVKAPEIFIWGYSYNSPVWSSGEASVGGLETRSPRNWSSLQTLFTYFDYRSDQISHNSPPGVWPVWFTVGAKRHLGVYAWRRQWSRSCTAHGVTSSISQCWRHSLTTNWVADCHTIMYCWVLKLRKFSKDTHTSVVM